MTLPFAAVSRNLAHYAVWIIIALIAIFAYAETGFYIAGKPVLADVLILMTALSFLLTLVLLDRFIRPKFNWTRAQWFRLFLIAVCGGLLVSAFTSSFWPWRGADEKALSYLLSFIAFIGSVGMIAYLYKFKPTLAGLTLATIAAAAMIVQIVIKMFKNSGWEYGIFLLIFFIFAGLTAALAMLLKHFADVTRKTKTDDLPDDIPNPVLALDIASAVLCSEEDVTETARHLEAEESPWYVETLIALAAIITAIFGVSFFGLMFAAMFNDSSLGVALLILGVPFYAGFIALRCKDQGGYPRHLFNTLIMVGAAMIVGGALIIALESEIGFEEEIVVALILLLAIINVSFVQDKIIEFLSVFLALNALYFYFIEEVSLPYADVVLAGLSIVLGIVLLTRVIGKRFYAAAGFAFLLYPALLATFTNNRDKVMALVGPENANVFSPFMLVKPTIGVLMAALAILFLNKTAAFKGWRPPIAVLIPLLLVLISFPFGGAFSFLLIAAGFILGNRLLALFGVLFQIYYLYMFYYELSISLGIKSYILLAVGVVLITLWAVMNKLHQWRAAS